MPQDVAQWKLQDRELISLEKSDQMYVPRKTGWVLLLTPLSIAFELMLNVNAWQIPSKGEKKT